VRDELLLDPNMTQVELVGVREYEIHVEVPQATLRRYGLTLKDVADTVTRASMERGGGSLKTSGGDILVRVKDRRDYAREYARLPLLTEENGSRILLEDVARVIEGFEDTDAWASYNGERAVMIEVYRVGNQTPIQVAGAAKLFLEKLNQCVRGFADRKPVCVAGPPESPGPQSALLALELPGTFSETVQPLL